MESQYRNVLLLNILFCILIILQDISCQEKLSQSNGRTFKTIKEVKFCARSCQRSGKIWRSLGIFFDNDRGEFNEDPDCLCTCPVPLEQDLILPSTIVKAEPGEGETEEKNKNKIITVTVDVDVEEEEEEDESPKMIFICSGGSRPCSDFCRSGTAVDSQGNNVRYPGGFCSGFGRCLCFCHSDQPNMIR